MKKFGNLKISDIKVGNKITPRQYKSNKIGVVTKVYSIGKHYIDIDWDNGSSGCNIEVFNELYINLTYEKNIIRLKKIKRINGK